MTHKPGTHGAQDTANAMVRAWFRVVAAEGENPDAEPLRALEMPYGQFRPSRGPPNDHGRWLTHGGTHHDGYEPRSPRPRTAGLLPAGASRQKMSLQ